MTGTSANQAVAPAGLSLPAPKIRLRSKPTGPVNYALFDGANMRLDAPVEVVLSELPSSAFLAENEVELRLFRYNRAKSRSSQHPTPSRWSALPHIEGGGNAYSASQWLGSTPASGGADRFARVQIAGLSTGDVIDATELARYWLRYGLMMANVAGGATATDKIIRSTWMPNVFYASPSRGVSRNIEPARFALAYVARDQESGFWSRVSSFSKFQISNVRPPFVWNPDDPGNIAPTVGNAGRRIWANNPGYDPEAATARITDSEYLAGWR